MHCKIFGSILSLCLLETRSTHSFLPRIMRTTHIVVVVSCEVMSNSFAAPWTVACQAPLSMGFSRQEYWGDLPFPSPDDLPNPGIKPMSPALVDGFFYPLSHQGSVHIYFSQFSRSVVSDSLRPHELQHTRPPCPSSTPGVHSDSHVRESSQNS